jgi:hypothetical protein
MRPITVTVGPLASASATNIRTVSGVGAAGNLTLDGSLVTAGVAILDTPRRILFTTTSNETTKTILLAGTNWAGDLISETVTLVNNSTVASVLDYKTVTSAYCSAALTGNLSIGTNGVAASSWVMMDPWAFNSIGVTVGVVGTVNYDIEITGDDPNDPTDPVAAASMIWFDCGDAGLVAETANASGVLTPIPRYARILLNSGSGSVRATFIQPGVVPE